MWIAFIFQYLWDTKQRETIPGKVLDCCELLSFFSIFGIQNNTMDYWFYARLVVNCFHFSVSLGYKTTKLEWVMLGFLLWIAFIFQYLWDTKQQLISEGFAFTSCELLSFFSIFGIQNNRTDFNFKTESVVNCFHFSVSLGYKTTSFKFWIEGIRLWIAFIFQYLWDTKQLISIW